METPLVSLGMGTWTQKHNGIFLYVLPELLVAISDTTSKNSQQGERTLLKVGVLESLASRSPFGSMLRQQQEKCCVLACELRLDNIVGVDWWAPLLEPARLVLEAKGIRQRQFKTVSQWPIAGCMQITTFSLPTPILSLSPFVA
jgi:hypothetical protein